MIKSFYKTYILIFLKISKLYNILHKIKYQNAKLTSNIFE